MLIDDKKAVIVEEFRQTLASIWATHGGGKWKIKLMVKDTIADITLQQVLTRATEFDVVATMNLNGDYLSDALPIYGILSDFSCTITLLYCDTRITRREEYDNYDLPIPFEAKAGGGTSFHPVFECVEEEVPVALIYFTDLCIGGDFPEDPGIPVLWVITEENKKYADNPPYGRILEIGE